MILHTEPPTVDSTVDDRRYLLCGGIDWPAVDPFTARTAEPGSLDFTCDAFVTLEDALNAWVRRLNSPDRRWASWAAGRMLDGPGADPVIELVDGDDDIEARWTLSQALDILDRTDELHHYVEPF
jgi:hypothetical protein